MDALEAVAREEVKIFEGSVAAHLAQLKELISLGRVDEIKTQEWLGGPVIDGEASNMCGQLLFRNDKPQP